MGPKGAAQPHALEWEAGYDRVVSFLRRQNRRFKAPDRGSFAERFQDNDLLRRVVAHINEVETGIASVVEPQNKLRTLIQKLFTQGKTISFDAASISVRTDDNISIGVQQLSSGEKQLLSMLVEAVCIPYGVLLIDEPELSMHEDWQRQLIESILSINSEIQLIAATHSPEIMARVPDDNIREIKH